MSEILTLAVALVPLWHNSVNDCLVKFPGLHCKPVPHLVLNVVIWGELFAPQSLFLGDEKWRNRRERGLDCTEGHQELPTVLIICSAIPGKGMSSWHEWWLEMSLGVITSNRNWNDIVSSGSIQDHHHQKNPRPSTQVQERLWWRSSLTKMAPFWYTSCSTGQHWMPSVIGMGSDSDVWDL